MALETDASVKGYGEVRGNGSYATGVDTDQIIGSLTIHGRALRGCQLNHVPARALELTGNRLIAALLEGAALDAEGRWRGLPVWRLLGDSRRRALSTHASVGCVDPHSAREIALEALAQGIRRFKIRVGCSELYQDLARVEAVREVVGQTGELAVDANGGWNAERALAILPSLDRLGVRWIEQPTPPDRSDELARVRASSPIPVIADESVMCATDIERLAAIGAVDGVHLKLEKCGILQELKRAALLARGLGLIVELGQMDQGRLGCALTTHLAAVIEADFYELWGFRYVIRDVTKGLELQDGHIPIPDGPGLGVEVDLDEAELVVEV